MPEKMPARKDAAENVRRRGFLNWFLGSSVVALFASMLYPILRFLSPPDVPESPTHQVNAGRTDDPEWTERGYKIIRFGPEPVLVFRTDAGEFKAFGATCTHLDCIVFYRREQKDIWCNCHNGQFDLQGRVLAGPPPRPLSRFEVGILDGSVMVTRG
jgi:cytochrome b6-f complex iron-sulfur subunit